jgi:GT2 family glycosyltransferase
MAFRTSVIEDARFDENLPLYAWQEDIDFAGQLRRRGRVVKTRAFVGVHRGVGAARSSGVRLGYSQIVNPLYLVRKKTMPGWFATKLIMRNFVANHIRAVAPEPWIDRAGRLRGNWIAVGDVVRGRADPKRILSL